MSQFRIILRQRLDEFDLTVSLFAQVDKATAVGGCIVDRHGRRVEVILLDRSDDRGPSPWIRVLWRGVLLDLGCQYAGIGRGYYRRVEDALALVDVESLVEVIDFPRLHPGSRREGTATAATGHVAQPRYGPKSEH